MPALVQLDEALPNRIYIEAHITRCFTHLISESATWLIVGYFAKMRGPCLTPKQMLNLRNDFEMNQFIRQNKLNLNFYHVQNLNFKYTGEFDVS